MGARDSTWQIGNGNTDSNAINREHLDIDGWEMPAAFTGANLSFKVGRTQATCTHVLKFEGAAVSVAVAAGDGATIDPKKFGSWPWVIAVSDAAEAGARTILPMFSDPSAK